jgi:hypothetical protein
MTCKEVYEGVYVPLPVTDFAHSVLCPSTTFLCSLEITTQRSRLMALFTNRNIVQDVKNFLQSRLTLPTGLIESNIYDLLACCLVDSGVYLLTLLAKDIPKLVFSPTKVDVVSLLRQTRIAGMPLVIWDDERRQAVQLRGLAEATAIMSVVNRLGFNLSRCVELIDLGFQRCAYGCTLERLMLAVLERVKFRCVNENILSSHIKESIVEVKFKFSCNNEVIESILRQRRYSSLADLHRNIRVRSEPAALVLRLFELFSKDDILVVEHNITSTVVFDATLHICLPFGVKVKLCHLYHLLSEYKHLLTVRPKFASRVPTPHMLTSYTIPACKVGQSFMEHGLLLPLDDNTNTSKQREARRNGYLSTTGLACANDESPNLTQNPLIRTNYTRLQCDAVRVLVHRASVPMVSYMGEIIVNKAGEHVLLSPFLESLLPMSEELEATVNMPRGAILALDTGAGKSVTSIAAMLTNTDKISLIITPDGLVDHWVSEVKKHTTLSGEAVLVFAKPKDVCNVQTMPNKPTLLIVSHSAVKTLPTAQYGWLIMDETHTIRQGTRIFKAISCIRADFRLAITATPFDRFPDILELIGFRGLLSNLGVDTSSSIVAQTYSLPVIMSLLIRGQPDFGDLEVDIQPRFVDAPLDYKCLDMANAMLGGFSFHYKNLSTIRILRIYERMCAGGQVDIELMTAVLGNLMKPSTGRNIKVRTDAPPTLTFNNKSEDCAICLCAFSDPVQLVCGHVLCRICLQSLLQIQRPRCAHCRADLGSIVQLWPPDWATERKRKIDTVKRNMFESDVVTLTGKQDLFASEVRAYIEERGPSSRLVVFVKCKQPAKNYIETLRQHKLTVALVGVDDTNRRDSLANIVLFREGKADVLVISATTQYSTGHDLHMASHLIVTDFTTTIAKLVQSIGRITRVGQVHKKVRVRILLYRNCLDHLLFTRRKLGNFTINHDNCIAWEQLSTSHVPGTPMYNVRLFAKIVWQLEDDQLEKIITYSARHGGCYAVLATRFNHAGLQMNISEEHPTLPRIYGHFVDDIRLVDYIQNPSGFIQYTNAFQRRYAPRIE